MNESRSVLVTLQKSGAAGMGGVTLEIRDSQHCSEFF